MNRKLEIDSCWGTLSGPPIIRKRPPVLPDLPLHTRCFNSVLGTAEIQTVGVDNGIRARDLLLAIRYANKLFDSFELSGPMDFQASIVLFARAFGIAYKVEGHITLNREDEWLTEEQMDDIAYAAEEAEMLHRLGTEMQYRTNGRYLCYKLAEAIKAEALALGLTIQESESRSDVSRYLTISGVCLGISTSVEVRISDHGFGYGNDRIDVRLQDSAESALLRIRNIFKPYDFNAYRGSAGKKPFPGLP